MKNKNWGALHYVDLFAGAGIEDVEGYGLDWGSPLIAAKHPLRFARLHLCEKSPRKFHALCDRVNQVLQPQRPQLLHGDANEKVSEILAEIADDSLSLAFLDPYGLHLHYETLRQLSQRRIDLIVMFPDHHDALRNWRVIYKNQLKSNLDLVLGTDRWREAVAKAPPDRWAQTLSKIYTAQIRLLGYTHFDYERISRPDGVWLYRLIFCARHQFPVDSWARCASNKPGGQRGFDFTDH
jgi:three-Cys-motif partner protein